jgi:hypothetical protein
MFRVVLARRGGLFRGGAALGRGTGGGGLTALLSTFVGGGMAGIGASAGA